MTAAGQRAMPLVSVEGLAKHFPVRGGLLQRRVGTVSAVDGVSFDIEEGDVFGLAGESGSGKSTIARMIVGLYRPTAGIIHIDGVDTGRLGGTHAFRKMVQMVFQNPGSSLNPRRTIAQSIAVPLRFHGYPGSGMAARVSELLEMVELPRSYVGRYPHELSGGQKQRVAIARALAVEPRLVVLDEPTSALDVSVQAKIIELLKAVARDLRLTFLFISHDLSLMRNFANRVGVLYLGKLCEVGPTEAVFGAPSHPYTRALISAVPVVSTEEAALRPQVPSLEGEVPSPANVPPGCSFHPRCPHAFDRCRLADPVFHPAGADHRGRCHLLDAA